MHCVTRRKGIVRPSRRLDVESGLQRAIRTLLRDDPLDRMMQRRGGGEDPKIAKCIAAPIVPRPEPPNHADAKQYSRVAGPSQRFGDLSGALGRGLNKSPGRPLVAFVDIDVNPG